MGKQLLVSASVRRATVSDVPGIHMLISTFASGEEMLPRTMSELYENIRDFTVAEVDGRLAGCAALHVTWETLGEIKSVAVRGDLHHKGIGSLLVSHVIKDSVVLSLERLFTLTYRPAFFSQFGFTEIPRGMLPHKVWGECIKCRKFPNCNETAMILHTDGPQPDMEAM